MLGNLPEQHARPKQTQAHKPHAALLHRHTPRPAPPTLSILHISLLCMRRIITCCHCCHCMKLEAKTDSQVICCWLCVPRLSLLLLLPQWLRAHSGATAAATHQGTIP